MIKKLRIVFAFLCILQLFSFAYPLSARAAGEAPAVANAEVSGNADSGETAPVDAEVENSMLFTVLITGGVHVLVAAVLIMILVLRNKRRKHK